MAALFLYGTLRHPPLLSAVLGRDDVRALPARLPGHRIAWAEGERFPLIEAGGAAAEGVLLTDLEPEDMDRLDFYETGFGYARQVETVETDRGPVEAQVYFPDPWLWQAGDDWDLADWERRWGALAVEAAGDVMAYRGKLPGDEVARRFSYISARAWDRIMARDRAAPQTLRSAAGAGAPEVEDRPGGWDGFFRFRPIRGSYIRFDGNRSEPVEREVFVSYDAALVLPYDPVRDRVLLIEQFRYGVALRGDPCSRVLEPIAGMVEAGEDPADSARREASEEAGLTLTDLRPMTNVYASPGYSTDFFHCFLAICDLDFEGGHIGGHPEEDEDIRSHVLSFDAAMALVESGEVNVAPLAMMLLWLARVRGGLRG